LIDYASFADSTVTDQGFNLVSRGDGWEGYIATDLVGTSAAPWDPLLGLCQYNGGQTPTMAPLPGSPVIDQGYRFGLTTDQRGSIRPYDYPDIANAEGGDGSDIGAVELRPAQPTLGYLFENVSSVVLSWNENEPGTGPKLGGPFFGMQIGSLSALSSGGAMPYMGPVRYFNGMYMVKDVIASGSLFYQLIGPASNINYIPPANTTSATQINATGAALNGTTIPIGSNTQYWFTYGFDTNYGNFTSTNSIGTSSNSISLTQLISGLNSSSTYHFQLIVTDDWGTQYGGDQVFSTSAPAPPPPAVQTLAASSITTNGALLNGGINGYGQTDAAFFQYGLDTNYGSSTESEQFFGTGYLQDYSNPVTGLNPATTYHYRAAGTTLSGWGYGQDMSFTTGTPPPAVVTLGATSITHGTATLNGTVNPNGASSTVYFQWGATTNYGSITTQTGVNAAESFTANLTGLPPNTTYHYRITALDSGGTSYGTDTNFTTLGD